MSMLPSGNATACLDANRQVLLPIHDRRQYRKRKDGRNRARLRHGWGAIQPDDDPHKHTFVVVEPFVTLMVKKYGGHLVIPSLILISGVIFLGQVMDSYVAHTDRLKPCEIPSHLLSVLKTLIIQSASLSLEPHRLAGGLPQKSVPPPSFDSCETRPLKWTSSSHSSQPSEPSCTQRCGSSCSSAFRTELQRPRQGNFCHGLFTNWYVTLRCHGTLLSRLVQAGLQCCADKSAPRGPGLDRMRYHAPCSLAERPLQGARNVPVSGPEFHHDRIHHGQRAGSDRTDRSLLCRYVSCYQFIEKGFLSSNKQGGHRTTGRRTGASEKLPSFAQPLAGVLKLARSSAWD